jgi:threonine dehydrogenase-like Zn-dependent dehydrogenase
MRAVGLDFEARRPVLGELPEPRAPRAGEVLFRVLETGICATDRELAEFRYGDPPPGETFLALGHEALGEVIETGPGAEGLERGTLVVPGIRRACRPVCEACAAGRRDLCLTGRYTERGIFGAHGYFTQLAVDAAEDLFAVPPALADVAILAEPLSVVEKAVETALRLHPLTPASAAVAGCGPIGLLTAFALTLRGIRVTIVSLEPEDHPKALLARRAGAGYLRAQAPAPAALVFDCSGSAAAAERCLGWLAPAGVLIFVGATGENLSISPLRVLNHNQALAGVVNAAPGHFRAALGSLARMPRAWLDPMIERRPFGRWAESLAAAPPAQPKIVHRL